GWQHMRHGPEPLCSGPCESGSPMGSMANHSSHVGVRARRNAVGNELYRLPASIPVAVAMNVDRDAIVDAASRCAWRHPPRADRHHVGKLVVRPPTAPEPDVNRVYAASAYATFDAIYY